jgi:hypothetical protein
VTGLSHSTIVSVRQSLEKHGVIEKLPRETVVAIYGEKDRRPPNNSDVWHLTGIVKQCNDKECTCMKILQASTCNLFYIPTSIKSIHDLNSIDSSPDPDSISTAADAPEPEPAPVKEKKPAERKRDLLFEAVLKGSFGTDYTPGMRLPKDTAGHVNRICGELRGLEQPPTGDEMKEYYAWYRSNNPDIDAIQSHTKLTLSVIKYRQAVTARADSYKLPDIPELTPEQIAARLAQPNPFARQTA